MRVRPFQFGMRNSECGIEGVRLRRTDMRTRYAKRNTLRRSRKAQEVKSDRKHK